MRFWIPPTGGSRVAPMVGSTVFPTAGLIRNLPVQGVMTLRWSSSFGAFPKSVFAETDTVGLYAAESSTGAGMRAGR